MLNVWFVVSYVSFMREMTIHKNKIFIHSIILLVVILYFCGAAVT